MGAPLTVRGRALLFASTVVALLASPALAADRYALVVTGASGDRVYMQRFDAWRSAFVQVLIDSLGYPADRVTVLTEHAGPGSRTATAPEVRSALAAIAARAAPDDVVLVLLMGHGTVFEGDDAKFNLVGPDLSVEEWAALVRPIRARVVFVNGAASSFAFLAALAGRNRIVVTATDTASQQYVTIFPDFFVRAFGDAAADTDKNGRVSVWESFTFASAGVKDWFEQQGRLATERPLLDDTGDGVGRDAGMPGPDGAVAQVTYLQAETIVSPSGDEELTRLLQRRLALVDEIDRLKVRRGDVPDAEYEAELERLLVELARVDRDIRARP